MDKSQNVLILNKLKGFLIIGFCFFIFFFLGGGNLCYLKSTIGVPCPGCGLTRAYLSLFNGNLKEAFYYHPLFFIPLLVIIVILLKFEPFIRFKIIEKIYSSKIFWICIIIAFLILYIIRMILFFPHTEPMIFNENNALFKLINLIKNQMHLIFS